MIEELTGFKFEELEKELFDDLTLTDEQVKMANVIKSLPKSDYNLLITYTFIPSYRKLAVLFNTTRFKINKAVNCLQDKIRTKLEGIG